MSAKSIILGSLLGDAISLGPHWVYDQAEIARKISEPEKFNDPISKYHPGKKAGDFTHYGDQSFLLLKHLAAEKTFDLGKWADVWQAYWNDASTISYRDGATRETLANLEAGKSPETAGSSSHDIAGASRIAPLFLLEWQDEKTLLQTARDLTAFTHNNPKVIAAAEFFAKVILLLNRGGSIPSAIDELGGSLSDFHLREWFIAGKVSAESETPDDDALSNLGLSCDIDGAFSGVIHFLIRYPADAKTALIENAKAGGDSAARGMILGAIYGAADLLDQLPEDWTPALNSHAEIQQCLAD